jgi:hypothetical protein
MIVAMEALVVVVFPQTPKVNFTFGHSELTSS